MIDDTSQNTVMRGDRTTPAGGDPLRERLREVFLLAELDHDGLAAVAAFSRLVVAGRGERIFQEGDAATALYAVLEGRVKVSRTTASGAEVVMHVQQPGDLVAEAAMFSLRRYPADCTALDDTLLVRIPASDFTRLLSVRPDISLAVMHGYSRRLRQFVETIGVLSSHDVRVRLARWLLLQLRSAGIRPSPPVGSAPAHGRRTAISAGEDTALQGPVIPLTGTRRDLAALLGTVPETLSRAFAALRRDGVIDDQRSEVRIVDPVRLQRIADS